MRSLPNPRATVLDFYESAYQAGARRASWDVERYDRRHHRSARIRPARHEMINFRK